MTARRHREKSPTTKNKFQGVVRGDVDPKRAAELERRIDQLMNPQDYKEGAIPEWGTITKDDTSGYFTVEELITLKPFKMEDMKEMIAFRVPDKLLRSVQRIKEHSAGAYDLISDLHRDIYSIGLIVMAERHQDILGGEIIIEKARKRVLQNKEIDDIVRRLAEQLMQEDDSNARSTYAEFMEHVQGKPIKVQERYVAAMELSPVLASLRRRMVELAKREELRDRDD